GTLGLIAGARALERADRKERAEQLLKKSRDPIARLELFLLQRGAGRETEAQKDLRAFATGMEKDEWPAPLFRVYLGQARDAAALEAAAGDDEECEANYYLGRYHARDDAAQARKYLEKATDEDCDRAQFAREDLAQLQSR